MVFARKTRMLGIVLVGAILTMAGTEGSSSAPQETLRFYRPGGEVLPRAVASWLRCCLRFDMVASVFTKFQTDRTYIFVSSGVKPTGGYNVRVSSIDRSSDRALALHVVYTAPPKGGVSTQQLTRPYDLVTVPDTGWAVTVIPEGNATPFRVAGLVGVRELKPIVSDSRAIKVISPRPGCTVGRAVDVSGVALVFEGNVQMRLTTVGGQVFARTFATAASAMDWGYFAKTLVVPDSVRPGTPFRLELYTMDEEKGGEANLVRIPLKLRRREGA